MTNKKKYYHTVSLFSATSHDLHKQMVFIQLFITRPEHGVLVTSDAWDDHLLSRDQNLDHVIRT